MIDTFKATHCGQTFTGAEGAKALELHMKAEHNHKPFKPGGRDRYADGREFGLVAPGWKNGEIEKPYPWKAPRPTPGGLEKVAQCIAAGEYRFEVVHRNSYRESVPAADEMAS